LQPSGSINPAQRGIDSSACTAFYLEEGYRVRGFFVDYGQFAARCEFASAKSIATHFSVPLSRLEWSGLSVKGEGYIPGRNAFLLISALMECPDLSGIIALGIHSGTNYSDCTPAFLRRMQDLFDTYSKGRIQIGAPFLAWKKIDIWKYCQARCLPVHLTYSCERGSKKPCGACLSCRDVEALRACPSQ